MLARKKSLDNAVLQVSLADGLYYNYEDQSLAEELLDASHEVYQYGYDQPLLRCAVAYKLHQILSRAIAAIARPP